MTDIPSRACTTGQIKIVGWNSNTVSQTWVLFDFYPLYFPHDLFENEKAAKSADSTSICKKPSDKRRSIGQEDLPRLRSRTASFVLSRLGLEGLILGSASFHATSLSLICVKTPSILEMHLCHILERSWTWWLSPSSLRDKSVPFALSSRYQLSVRLISHELTDHIQELRL